MKKLNISEICSAVIIIAFLDLDNMGVETKITSLSRLQATALFQFFHHGDWKWNANVLVTT
jgi:hypothetical protein